MKTERVDRSLRPSDDRHVRRALFRARSLGVRALWVSLKIVDARQLLWGDKTNAFVGNFASLGSKPRKQGRWQRVHYALVTWAQSKSAAKTRRR